MYNKARYLANKEKQKAYSRAWYLANPEKHKSYINTSRANNPEKYRDYLKSWQLANPDKCNAATAKRRALKLKATPIWADSEKIAIEEMYSLAKQLTIITGIKHQVDHIVPLNSDIVQGLHCLANLQILCAKENISKGNRTWPNMP